MFLTAIFCKLLQIRNVSAPKVVSNVKPVKKILFCGWRRDMDDMIIVSSRHALLVAMTWSSDLLSSFCSDPSSLLGRDRIFGVAP